jgi:hypothetical protein
MKQVPDRKKLRREYLRRKAFAYGIGGIFLVITLTFFVAWLHQTGLDSVSRNAFLYCSVLVFFVWTAVKVSRDAVKSVPYVPPVISDDLPADEILVRGSEELPVAQSEVLLRGAQKGEETPKEELLRVNWE